MAKNKLRTNQGDVVLDELKAVELELRQLKGQQQATSFVRFFDYEDGFFIGGASSFPVDPHGLVSTWGNHNTEGFGSFFGHPALFGSPDQDALRNISYIIGHIFALSMTSLHLDSPDYPDSLWPLGTDWSGSMSKYYNILEINSWLGITNQDNLDPNRDVHVKTCAVRRDYPYGSGSDNNPDGSTPNLLPLTNNIASRFASGVRTVRFDGSIFS